MFQFDVVILNFDVSATFGIYRYGYKNVIIYIFSRRIRTQIPIETVGKSLKVDFLVKILSHRFMALFILFCGYVCGHNLPFSHK